MNRSVLYVIIGILIAVAIGLGVYIYQQQTRPALQIEVDDSGISVQGG